MTKNYKYDVAISFAEEDRDAAVALACALELKGFKNIYYYPDRREETWGGPLGKELSRIYSDEARCAVLLLSEHYFNPKKTCTHIELAAIRKRAQREAGIRYMLPVKLHDKVSLELHPDLDQLTHLTWQHNPKEIAQLLKLCLGKRITKSITRVMISGKAHIIINRSSVGNFNIINIKT